MSTTLETYWSTYNSTCPPTSSFLSSYQYIVYPLQYSNTFFIPLAILAGYCVLYKIPKAMLPMKWVYFNLHVWISVQSVYLTLLLVPYVWLPVISTTYFGILSNLGVEDVTQGYIGCVLLLVPLSATVSLFENRHQQIQNNQLRERRKLVRYPMLGFNYLYSIVSPYPIFSNPPDQLTAKIAFLKTVPCPNKDFFHLHFYTFSNDPQTQKYLFCSMMLALGFVMIQLVFYSATCLHYLVFAKENITLTSKMRNRRQKRFFLGILMQISVTYGFMSPALIYCGVSFFTGYYNQKLNNVLVYFLSLNGTVSTIALLFSHRAYRKALGIWLQLEKKNDILPSIFCQDFPV